jgi:tetratricopeptide (TPR) repeat protein
MRLDRSIALAGATLLWLVALPSQAANQSPADLSFGEKSFAAVFSICRVEARAESHDDNRTIFIQTGMGDGGFPVLTANPKAQVWFNYGLKMFHAFYHNDARLAFDNAVAADPHCAMCLWGQALSRGAVLNFDAEEADFKSGLEIAKRAQAQARTPRDKLLTTALVRRYSRPQDAAAEHDFAADLLKADKARSTPDLQLLAAEVVLTERRRGATESPEALALASQAVALVEAVLAKAPNNTAAIHYYIHATEVAGHAQTALPYAEKLAVLAPNASHLIHMAAHTYYHVGRYEDAAAINASAMRTDSDHLTQTKTAGGLSGAVYYQHNLSFGMAGALMSGDRTLALKFADHLHRAFPQKDFAKDGISYDEGRRFIIYARYEPKAMLSLPEPTAEGPETLSFYHYARGEAFAALGDAKSLAMETEKIGGDDRTMEIARAVLMGRLAMLQQRFADAAHAFEQAMVEQDGYSPNAWDPPPWWYPVRRSAAAAWLADGQFAKAEEAARKSLTAWPADPLTLLVLSRANNGLGHHEDASRYGAQAIGLWMGDISRVNPAAI